MVNLDATYDNNAAKLIADLRNNPQLAVDLESQWLLKNIKRW
jgi:hypothetical protein